MDNLLNWLNRAPGVPLLALTVVALALALIVAAQAAQLARLRSRWRDLLGGVGRENLETLLYDHLRQRVAAEEELHAITERLKSLEMRMKSAKRYMGLVRFDAFEDVGGAQSFSLAVYDEEGNGAVLSSLVGRADCRVYCKQIVGGRSERNLSTEEMQAIELAGTNRAKPRVSS